MSSSSSSSPTSPTRTVQTSTSTWQNKLQETCKARNIQTPEFRIVSDRRGGRTAWSAHVVVNGVPVAARFWYDGQFVNNAKEDAAEVALGMFQKPQQTKPYHRPYGAIL